MRNGVGCLEKIQSQININIKFLLTHKSLHGKLELVQTIELNLGSRRGSSAGGWGGGGGSCILGTITI